MEIFMSFPSVGVDAGYTNRIVMPWNKAKWPPAASAAASVSSSATVGVTIPLLNGQNNAYMSECCAVFEWESTQTGGSITAGSEVAIGQVLRLPPGATTARVYSRFFVNNVDRFSNVMFTINDENGEQGQFQVTSIPTSFTDIDTGTLNLSSPGSFFGMSLLFQGTTDYTKIGVTQVYLDYLAVLFTDA